MAAPSITRLYGNLPVLGHNVSWLLRGVEILHDDLVTQLTRHGFGGYAPIRPPATKRAVRRAVRDWIAWRLGRPVAIDDSADESADVSADGRVLRRTGRAASTAGKLIRAHEGSARDAYAVYSLIHEESDVAELCLSYGTEVRFFLEKTTGTLTCTTSERGMIAAETEAAQIARELWPFWNRHTKLYLAGDLGRIVTAIISGMRAISIRDGGGVYFVPRTESDALERAATFVAALPTSTGKVPTLMRFPILDVESVRAQIRVAAEQEFAAELDRVEADLVRFEEQAQAQRAGARPATVQGRIDAYLALREKAAWYASTVGMRQERVVADLDVAAMRAAALLTGDTQRQERGTDGRWLATHLDDAVPAAPRQARR